LITIYQSATTLRVVVGKHKPVPPLPGLTARQYPSLTDALLAETNSQTRSTLALLAQERTAGAALSRARKPQGRSPAYGCGPIEIERESQVPEPSHLASRPQSSAEC
jgi:hypothetical protein